MIRCLFIYTHFYWKQTIIPIVNKRLFWMYSSYIMITFMYLRVQYNYICQHCPAKDMRIGIRPLSEWFVCVCVYVRALVRCDNRMFIRAIRIMKYVTLLLYIFHDSSILVPEASYYLVINSLKRNIDEKKENKE